METAREGNFESIDTAPRHELVKIINGAGECEERPGYVIEEYGIWDSNNVPVAGGWTADGRCFANEVDANNTIIGCDGKPTKFKIG